MHPSNNNMKTTDPEEASAVDENRDDKEKEVEKLEDFSSDLDVLDSSVSSNSLAGDLEVSGSDVSGSDSEDGDVSGSDTDEASDSGGGDGGVSGSDSSECITPEVFEPATSTMSSDITSSDEEPFDAIESGGEAEVNGEEGVTGSGAADERENAVAESSSGNEAMEVGNMESSDVEGASGYDGQQVQPNSEEAAQSDGQQIANDEGAGAFGFEGPAHSITNIFFTDESAQLQLILLSSAAPSLGCMADWNMLNTLGRLEELFGPDVTPEYIREFMQTIYDVERIEEMQAGAFDLAEWLDLEEGNYQFEFHLADGSRYDSRRDGPFEDFQRGK